MLKSLLGITVKQEPKRPTLPHLFRHRDMGFVVLFVSEHEGVVVYNDTRYNMGHYGTSWTHCHNEQVWEPLLPGESVTLTVEED